MIKISYYFINLIAVKKHTRQLIDAIRQLWNVHLI